MKQTFVFLYFLAIVFRAPTFAQKAPSGYQYISPVPNSTLNSRSATIIIRQGSDIEESSLNSVKNYSLSGSKSGNIPCSFSLSDDRKTIVGMPGRMFLPGEAITFRFEGGIKTVSGAEIAPLQFSFTVTPLERPLTVSPERQISASAGGPRSLAAVSPFGSLDSLPSDFPSLRVDTLASPAPGYIFLSVTSDVAGTGFYNYILDEKGKVVKYKKIPAHYPYAFRVQPNGLLSYADAYNTYAYAGGGQCIYKILDTSLAVVDSFQCGNGYLADSHEFQILPNGHALMVAYDLQPVDMSLIVPNGHPGAMVFGSIIQELDLKKRVIFQWRSWDAIPITDSYQNLAMIGFDYIHVNSAKLDYDGNFVFTSRLLCEITKVNRMTGEIMWRMGGKKNQFTFLNENPQNSPTFFSHPHSLEILPNGHYLFFDNGLLHTPQYSRAVEYDIDEKNKTAALVWEYRRSPDIYAATAGSVQRLSNGNTLIGWGSASIGGFTAVTEVTPAKEKTFELSMFGGIQSYRAGKYPYKVYRPVANVSLQDLLQGVQYEFVQGAQNTGIGILFNQYISGYNYVRVEKHLSAPTSAAYSGNAPQVLPMRAVILQNGIASFNADVTFDSSYYAGFGKPQSITVYQRSSEGTGIFTPLLTSYNSETKQLFVTVTKFGEFIFAVNRTNVLPGTPKPFAPKVDALVDQTKPLTIGFCSVGITTSFHLQVSTDSAFSALVVNDSMLQSGTYIIQSPLPAASYYYRVRGRNDIGWSPWSSASRFTTSPQFLNVTAPKGGEIWSRTKQYFIRWSSNTSGYMRIELLRKGTLYSLISPSAPNSGAYAWKIPDSLANDSSYTIRLTHAENPSLSASSFAPFSIVPSPSGIDGSPGLFSFALHQNYPNPFNPLTIIGFRVGGETEQKSGKVPVVLCVLDMLGNSITTLLDAELSPGDYSVPFNAGNLSSGMYLYTLQAGSFRETKKMLLLR